MSRPTKEKSGPDHAEHPDNYLLVEACARQLRAIVVAGDPLYWRLALRRVAAELDKHPGNPKCGPMPIIPVRLTIPEYED